ncbi:trypsin-like peptidase domain-containing protein [Paenibacillus filicis]|uniref:Probable periplasmic serine endoprotease DegP-like n=1 Tax=Paenibacillus gyeongsangnamensis TaxID=3388067 RepID=A0ABT4QEH6_9BACL|nr:trypsin-like peptidase domain-containing protein [Paenibacillus filicis]MCZ8515280.1 trypsin-like peptidase domain-containing protein [Paenibacillus filicis]
MENNKDHQYENQNDNDMKQGKEESGNIKVTHPRLIESYSTSGNGGGRGFSGKSAFAAFMAGALVVSGLMFASDKMNLFTGRSQPLATSVSAAGSAAGSSGATKASYDASNPNSISTIAKKASPAVVKIETLVQPAKRQTRGSNSFFDQFFGGQGGGQSGQQSQSGSDTLQPQGIGSGFIFESSGYILTNEHVIDGADEIDVTVQGYDKPFKAKLLGSSYDLDLAVLKIENSTALPTLPIGNSDNTNVGDWVVAIGNPYDFDYTVTSGLLSAKDRPISIADENGTRNYKHLIQTDAAINPGNSGGPLLGMNGEVIGINTAVSSQAQGIGFAIPSSTISSVLNDLKNNVAIPKEASPYIGVSLQDVTDDMLNDLQLKNTDGALVADVQVGSPAFAAGIRSYDVIVAANGKAVATSDALTKVVQEAKVGDKMAFTIMRGGQKQDVTVTIGDRNPAAAKQK